MKHASIVIILTMISHTTFGQNINGKWVLKEIHSGNGQKGSPGFQLLDINNDSVDVYTDFSLQEKTTTLKMDQGNLLNQNNDKTSTYEIVSDNHLKWYVPGKVNGTEAVFECDYYRLEPTITTLKKEEIEKLTFVFMENGRASEFVFNKELWDKENLERFKRTEGEKKMIEQIDSTFFVSMYYNGKRSGSIPIKEVNIEYLKLYAIPTGPMELTAYRKE